MEFFYFSFVILIGIGVVGYLIESNNKKVEEHNYKVQKRKELKWVKEWKRDFERKYPDYFK